MRSEAEWAWAAGFFEGEGSISLVRDRYIMLSVTSTDRDVLQRFADVVGHGGVHPSRLRPGQRKQQYRWSLGNRPYCLTALNHMLPWFGERRTARALEALAIDADRGTLAARKRGRGSRVLEAA